MDRTTWPARVDELAPVVASARQALIADHGRLWGLSPRPRWILAEDDTWWLTELVPGSVLCGELCVIGSDPGLFTANTHVTWRGTSWAMVSIEEGTPDVRLLLHEAFHAFWQPETWGWVEATDAGDDALSTVPGRALLLAELRGWSIALRTGEPDDARRAHSIRRSRLDRLSPAECRRQDYLDLWEGLAEYSAWRWTGADVEEVAELADRGPEGSSWFRSLSYTTGPVLGYVLDQLDTDRPVPWRTDLRRAGSLSALLDTRLLDGAPGAAPPATLREALATVGYQDLADRESLVIERLAVADAQRRSHFEHVLWIPLRGAALRFDPREVRRWDLGTMYLRLGIHTEELDLEAEDGAVVTTDWAWAGLPCPTRPPVRAGELCGPGWQLTLHRSAEELGLQWCDRPPQGSGK